MAQRMNQVVPANHDWQMEKVFAAQNVAIVLLDLGQPEEALALSRQARAEVEAIARTHPEDAVSAGNTIGWSAVAEAALGHDELAIADENAKIVAAQRAPNADKDQDVRYLVANAHGETAAWLRNLGRIDEALAVNRGAIAELAALRARDPSNLDMQSELAGAHVVMSELLLVTGDRDAAKAELGTATDIIARLMARPVPKRHWRIRLSGHALVTRARLATTPAEAAAVERQLAAYLADIETYVREGNELSTRDQSVIADTGLVYGDLLMKRGQADEARAAWQAAAARLRPLAERLNPAAMTLLGQADLRLGGAQDARAWAERVMGTSYRHPAFADLLKQLGPAQQAGGTPRP
jgi:tetratricopeptide (TPR) repeat protein